MQVKIHENEIELFKGILNGDRFLTDAQTELLKRFSNRIILKMKDDIFNNKLVYLKTYVENEFKNGCYGISCSDCKLDEIGTECRFREFNSQLRRMDV